MKEATRRIMSAFLCNDVLVQLNWTGQGEKMAFGKMKSAEIVRSKFVAFVHVLKTMYTKSVYL